MDSNAQWARLRSEQERAMTETNERINTLRAFKDDYRCLQERMQTLPDKTTHNVMVPFGKKAFMPGQLIHTNEVMVLLGDNWFAERSAKQACEIVDRRVAVLDKQIEELNQQRKLLKPRAEFTSQLQTMAENRGDVVEITEEYNEEKELSWRERHKESVRKHNQQQRRERQQRLSSPHQPDVITRTAREREKKAVWSEDDAEMWRRLDELEARELQDAELDADSDGSTTSDGNSDDVSDSDDDDDSAGATRKVRWKDTHDDVTAASRVIRFSHTLVPANQSPPADATTAATASCSDNSISTPADIFKHYAQHHKSPSHTKSILKAPSSRTQQSPSDVGQNTESRASGDAPQFQHSSTAFTASVVEKSTSVNHPMPDHAPTTAKSVDATKKVSRFKAQRMAAKK